MLFSFHLKLPIEKGGFGLFCHQCHSFVAPFLVILSVFFLSSCAFFCHSEGALATEESPQETLRLRVRVTRKKPQGDKKGVILRVFFVILPPFLSF